MEDALMGIESTLSKLTPPDHWVQLFDIEGFAVWRCDLPEWFNRYGNNEGVQYLLLWVYKPLDSPDYQDHGCELCGNSFLLTERAIELKKAVITKHKIAVSKSQTAQVIEYNPEILEFV